MLLVAEPRLTLHGAEMYWSLAILFSFLRVWITSKMTCTQTRPKGLHPVLSTGFAPPHTLRSSPQLIIATTSWRC
ncbi:hypothetical protein BD779DRAFT_1534043 [Infundibulicybe gibba]|nr:hypothetical protein BD779DRAFT_1534043 [Infundibulicybe gibba]